MRRYAEMLDQLPPVTVFALEDQTLLLHWQFEPSYFRARSSSDSGAPNGFLRARTNLPSGRVTAPADVTSTATGYQEGVEKVLDILRAELQTNMRQAGTRSIAEITPSFVVDNRRA